MFSLTCLPDDTQLRLLLALGDFCLYSCGSLAGTVEIHLCELPAGTTRSALGDPAWRRQWLSAMPASARQTYRVEAGLIPLLHPGLAFHGQRQVWMAPMDTITYSLTKCDELPQMGASDTSYDMRMDDPLESTIPTLCAAVPCQPRWLLQDQGRTISMPRTEIFRRCYAPHSEVATMLLSSSWPFLARHYIEDQPRPDGFSTCVTDEHIYQLLLRRRLSDRVARLLAVLHHEPYARQCVNLLYCLALRDRGRHAFSSWPCRAPFPFRASPEQPLRLTLDGWWAGDEDASKTFHVLAIRAISFPSYLPRIVIGKPAPSSAAAKRPAPPSTTPPAAAKARRRMQAADAISIVIGTDASAQQPPTKIVTDSDLWDDAPPINMAEPLTTHRTTAADGTAELPAAAAKSTQATDDGSPGQDESATTRTSAGKKRDIPDAPGEARVEPPRRESAFRPIHGALLALQYQGALRSVDVIEPLIDQAGMPGTGRVPIAARVAGLGVWSLPGVAQASRMALIPGWCYLEPNGKATAEARVAFITRLRGPSGIGYSIELSLRARDMRRLIVVTDVITDELPVLMAVLRGLIVTKGYAPHLHLREHLPEPHPCRIRAYTHTAPLEDAPALTTWMRKCLHDAGICAP